VPGLASSLVSLTAFAPLVHSARSISRLASSLVSLTAFAPLVHSARSISRNRNRNRIIMTWLCQYNFSYKNTDPGISSTDIAHDIVSRVVHLLRCAPRVHSTRSIRPVISRNWDRIIMTWLRQYNFSYKNTDPGISSTDIAHKSAFHFYRRCNI
jgi:hypothetical protein